MYTLRSSLRVSTLRIQKSAGKSKFFFFVAVLYIGISLIRKPMFVSRTTITLFRKMQVLLQIGLSVLFSIPFPIVALPLKQYFLISFSRLRLSQHILPFINNYTKNKMLSILRRLIQFCHMWKSLFLRYIKK